MIRVFNLFERRNWDVKKRLLSSIDKAENILGYIPQTSFFDGLVFVHKWFEKYWDFIQDSAEFSKSVKNENINGRCILHS